MNHVMALYQVIALSMVLLLIVENEQSIVSRWDQWRKVPTEFHENWSAHS
jgi:hypothetical protein